jgi:hypothetical protein
VREHKKLRPRAGILGIYYGRAQGYTGNDLAREFLSLFKILEIKVPQKGYFLLLISCHVFHGISGLTFESKNFVNIKNCGFFI